MSKTLAVLALTLPAANAASHSAYTWTKLIQEGNNTGTSSLKIKILYQV